MKKLVMAMVILFAGCGAPAHFFIDRTYVPKPDSKAVLIPLSSYTIDNYNPKEVEKHFNDDHRSASDILADSIGKNVKRILSKSLQNITFPSLSKFDSLQLQISDDRYFRDFDRKVGRDSAALHFRIPRKNIFDALDSSIGIYFVITAIKIERNATAGSPGHWMMKSAPSSIEASVFRPYSPSFSAGPFGNSPEGFSTFTPPAPPVPHTPQYMPGGGGSDNLTATVRYAVWDRNSDATVCYGEAVVNQGIFLAMTKDTWLELFDKIGHALARHSPFVKTEE